MTEAEAATERKDIKTVYQFTRKLRGDRGQNLDLTVKAKDGYTITEEKANLRRRREHHPQLLNRCDPPTLADIGEAEQDMKIGPITVQKVKNEINMLKNV